MKTLHLFFLLILPCWLFSQQISDTNYNPNIKKPAYETGKGPVVFIDEGHHNFHTKEGRYKPFANLIERDGYVVKSYEGAFDRNKLDQGKILVISNALNELNVQNWYLPNPSAFTADEIGIVKKWVHDGGSLFLIADHMPMAGAATDLAAAFGFEFTNGFVMQKGNSGPDYFNLKKGNLVESALTKGRDDNESVRKIASFTGQAFKIPEDATPVLLFDDRYTNYLPDTAWVFNEKTTQYKVKGWSQGAFKQYGKGRIVVFGEAAMFSAQLAGAKQRKVGMNSDDAPENFQLLLNIIHWLDGKIDRKMDVNLPGSGSFSGDKIAESEAKHHCQCSNNVEKEMKKAARKSDKSKNQAPGGMLFGGLSLDFDFEACMKNKRTKAASLFIESLNAKDMEAFVKEVKEQLKKRCAGSSTEYALRQKN